MGIIGTGSERRASQVALVVKNPPASSEDIRYEVSVPESKRFPGGGNDNPLQYSCLENPMDRGAWWDMVHGLAESDSTERLNNNCIEYSSTISSSPEANIKACYFLWFFFYVLFV